ncbi:MAG: TolC family protein [Candidatus Brocadiaceae bacterium]|nr:TolC family protein [Candidatus Brocadiaceae bacterium]
MSKKSEYRILNPESRSLYSVSCILCLLLAMGIGNPPQADCAERIGLKEAVQKALENNLELQAFRQRLEEARGDLRKASLLLPSNPTVGTEIWERHITNENARSTDYAITLSQEFRIAGQRGKGISVAEKNLEKVTAEVETLEWDITARVKKNFYEVLALKKVLEARQTIQGLYERLREAMQLKFKEGAATILELNTANIQYNRARRDYQVASGGYASSLLGLKLLLALPEDHPLEPTGELGYAAMRPDLPGLIKGALQTRPDLKAVEREVERADLEIGLLKSQRIPNPSLSGFVGREEGTQRIVGGGISIPLPLIDRKQGELQKAGASKEAARLNLENKHLQIRKEVQSAYEVFLASQKGLEAYEGIIPEMAESLKLNELTYTEGKVGFVEFVLLQNNLIEAKISYLEALLDYYRAIVDLEKAATRRLVE